jgi:subtilisin-like proprotein convertase family protein
MRAAHRLALLFVAAIFGFAVGAHAQTVSCVGGGGTNCTGLIPDANGATPGVLLSTIPVGATCVAPQSTAVSVSVDLKHDWVGDLRLRVIGPLGQTATLLDRTGVTPTTPGGCTRDDIVATFTDGAAAFPCNFTIPAGSGSIAPVTPLSVFNNLATSGTWTLEITDNLNSGIGALEDWSVNVVCGAAPAVTIVATDAFAAETPLDTGTFTVTRSVVTDQALLVNITITGTATNGVDYVLIPLTVTIPANQASATITVTPIADGMPEAPETVIASIAAGTFYTIGSPSSATVTITDVPIQVGSETPIPTLSPIALAVLAAALGLVGFLFARRVL